MTERNENEAFVDGVRYVARVTGVTKCYGCVAQCNDEMCLALPPCGPLHRRAGDNVIFVEDDTETPAAAAVTSGEVCK